MGTVSKAQRRSANKWDAQNMKVISTKLRVEDAEAFKRYAEDRGQTVSGMIAGYVRRCLAEDKAARQTESGE